MYYRYRDEQAWMKVANKNRTAPGPVENSGGLPAGPSAVGKISRTVQFLPLLATPARFYREISTYVLASYSTRGIRRSGCIQMAVRWVVKTSKASEVSGCSFSRLGVPFLRVLDAGSPRPPYLAYHLTACCRSGRRPRQEANTKN